MKAAEAGYINVMTTIGKMYLDGKDVDKNIEEGMKWLQRAADNGDIEIICTNTKCLKKWNVFIKSGQIRYEPVEKQENAS